MCFAASIEREAEMDAIEMEKVFREKFPDAVFQPDTTGQAGVRWSIVVPLSAIRNAAMLLDGAGYFLETLTGLDFEDTLELVYHFNQYAPRSRVAVRVPCGHDQSPDSIYDIFSAAGWLEREVHEFFGVEFKGNPDLRPLLLPEDTDSHPLRKSFGKAVVYHKRESIYG